MENKKFKMGPLASLYQWFCVILLFILLFWDCLLSELIKQHLVITVILMISLALIANFTDYYFRLKKADKELNLKKQKSVNDNS